MDFLKKTIVVFTALFISLPFAFSADKGANGACGLISYSEGDAFVTHNGKQAPVEIGTTLVYDNDLIRTNARARIEIDLAPATGFSGTVKVGPSTSFYFTLSNLKGQPNTTMQLLGGQLSMKMKKISGSPAAQVRTESTVAGVRGTEFSVQSAPTGDLLISCDEGLVSLSADDGEETEAPAGTAVEKALEDKFKSQTLNISDLASFRDRWYSEKIEALRADPSRAVKQFSAYYLDKKADFEKNIVTLEQSAALRKLLDSALKGDAKGSRMGRLKELRSLDAPMFAIKKNLFSLERYYYRLQEISEYASQGKNSTAVVSTGKDGSSVTVADFYQKFNREKAEIERKIAFFHFAEKIYDANKPVDVDSDADADDFFND